ncbi:MAG: hypothetical protein M3Q06_13445 [Bacteroidota bacterium]|nr:hypothetical protein [Bacteroidota bacterium]
MHILGTKLLICYLLVLAALPAAAQTENYTLTDATSYSAFSPVAAGLPRKLFQRNTGMVLGWQRGRYTAIELGVEGHWRKISLASPHIIGATANLEYNFGNNVLGYKAGAWMKRGRINLTYGANVSYFTNFKEGHRFGIGPSVGFRLLGFHLMNGINFLTADGAAETSKSVGVNSLYVSLRYYFPVQNRFVWDRQTRLRKKERQKAREERREKGEGGIFRIFRKKSETP